MHLYIRRHLQHCTYIQTCVRIANYIYIIYVPSKFIYLLLSIHSSDTAPGAVFAGSMQLLAGVKLCTGRTITNHPHFENKLLRERTVQV